MNDWCVSCNISWFTVRAFSKQQDNESDKIIKECLYLTHSERCVNMSSTFKAQDHTKMIVNTVRKVCKLNSDTYFTTYFQNKSHKSDERMAGFS